MKQFAVYWERDNRTPSPRPTPIRAETKAEAKLKFQKRWPYTKILKILIKG